MTSAVLPPERPRRLQTQIGIALGGLMLLLALALAALLAKTAEREVLRLSAENLENLSQQMGRELSQGMHDFSRQVGDQALRERYTNPDAQPAEMRAALEQFKQLHPEFAYVSIIDAPTARVVAANGGIFEGGSASGRPTFEEGRKGLFLGDVHDAVRLAELLPKPENGESLRFLDVAAPIHDASGRVIRVFAAHVAWQWTNQVRDKVFGPVKERRGVEVFLVDTSGKVVLQGAPDVRVGTGLASLTGTLAQPPDRATWPDGKSYLTYVANVLPEGRFSGFGWKVIARQPYELVYGSVRGLQQAFLIGGLALGLLAAGIAWLVTGRLTRPLRALDSAARAAALKDEAIELPRGDAIGELTAVQQAITRLTATAREQSRAAQTTDRQFEILAASLPQVVWQADADGRMAYVNKAWIRARHGDAPFLVADLVQVVHADDCAEFSKAWQRSLATSQDLKVRCRLHAPPEDAPRWFDLEAHAVTDDDGRAMRWVGTIFDVHDMMTLAERTQQALDEERAARAEAERTARMRDEFLATVSHELRSPLSAITGWSEILARKGGADEMLQKAAAVILRNASLQARLIDDLLDMSAMLAGKLTLATAPFDLGAVVKEATLSQLHAAQRKGVALNCSSSDLAMVEADPKRIQQVLSNLIGNAVKFTDPGGRIEVSVIVGLDAAQVRVKDSGKGIAAQFLPHVFDRLRQEDASITRKAGGLGLGLAIAKAVVELHQGRIEAHSAGPGIGATFSFTLPLCDPSASDAPPRAALEDKRAPTDLGHLRVLLIDDEQDARDVAQVALASLGASVKSVSSAREGLQLLQAERFDVIVSDIGMPEMDGLAFIRAVRELPPGKDKQRSRDLPALALTAFAMESERQRGIAAGFQAYVTKPISLWKLGDGIHEAIAKAPARV